MNADVPVFEAFVRDEYLYDGDQGKLGGYTPALVFGITSLESQALGWWVLTEEGAMVGRLPIVALSTKPHAEHIPLDHLQLWDCFSYRPVVHEWERLSMARCSFVAKDLVWHDGRYLFTVDWHGSACSESPGDTGWKCAHVIELDCGCLAAQPNNRMRWYDPSWVSRPFAEPPKYRTNTRTWKCENRSKWTTGPGFFYDVKNEAPT